MFSLDNSSFFRSFSFSRSHKLSFSHSFTLSFYTEINGINFDYLRNILKFLGFYYEKRKHTQDRKEDEQKEQENQVEKAERITKEVENF